MAKSPRTGGNRGRQAGDRRRGAQEQVPLTPAATPAIADDRSAAAAAPVKRQGHPTREEIATRAYEIYTARGGTHGYDIEDWLQAERELRAAN